MKAGFRASVVRHFVCLNILLTGLLAPSWLALSSGSEPSTGLSARDHLLITLTDDERAWLRDHPVITLAHDPAWPPVEFSDEHGEISGMAGDYVKLVEQRLGVKFTRLRNLSWQESFARQKRWEIDMGTCVAKTPQRMHFWAFTKPYMTIPIVIATRLDVTYIATMEELYGKSVALVEGYAIDDWITADFPQINLTRVKDPQEGFALLQRGEVFAFIDNLLIIAYYQSRMKVTNIKIAGQTPYVNAQRMAVRKDWAPLAAIFDKALDSISESERRAIHEKWLPLRFEVGFNYTLFWQMLAGCSVIFLVLLFWIRKLSREIQLRKLAEDNLRESQTLLSKSQKIAHIGSWTLDLATNRLTWSDEVYQIFGQNPQEFIPTYEAFLEAVHPDDREAVHATYKESVSEGRETYAIEHRLVRPGSGEVRFVQEKCEHIKDASGKIVRSIGMLQDITERKNAELDRIRIADQFIQSQKMEAIGTLAGGIAHDFNNMLAVIIGFTELSLEKLPKDSPAQYNLDQVLQASSRARDLVKQILAFSRKSTQEHKPLQLSLIIKEAVKMLRATIPSTIEIQQHITDQPLMVNANSTQIHQLMMNLGTNAAQAMSEESGILEIELTSVFLDSHNLGQYPGLQQGQYVQLTVRDTGHGIDPSTIDRIFEPFFTTKEPNKGTGMGLAVVHGIVKDHGGAIKVYSEPGKGTTFHVLLPTMEEIPPEQSEGTAPLPRGSERVLFVDDEESLVDVGQKLLESLGYTVTVCHSSFEALDTFRREPGIFDLVITDQTMPHMTGDMLSGKLMEIRPDIPIILCTGYSEKVSEEKAQELGIKTFVIKPLSRQKMAELIRRVLDR